MHKGDVLQALAGLRVDGVEPLADGCVQDVLVEWHEDGAHVAVVLDREWRGKPPSEGALAAIRQRVARLPAVASVRTVLRARPSPGGSAAGTSAGPAGGRRRPRPPVPEGARLVAVASGKGGVGKSTVAANLAVALARRGTRVAILDCDVYGFSVPDLLGVEEPAALRDRRLVPPRAHGVQVMSMEFFVPGNRPVVWRGPMLGTALRQLMGDTLWDEPQVMVLDLPPGTGDVALDVHEFFPDAAEIIVTTPDPFAARVAERAGTMALETGHVVLGVVENLAYLTCEGCGRRLHPFGRGGGDAVAAALGVPVLARIPHFPPGAGRTDGLCPPETEAGRAYDQLARGVLAGLAGKGERS